MLCERKEDLWPWYKINRNVSLEDIPKQPKDPQATHVITKPYLRLKPQSESKQPMAFYLQLDQRTLAATCDYSL